MLADHLLLLKSPFGVAIVMTVFVLLLAFFKTRKYTPKDKTPTPHGANLPIIGCLSTIAEAWPLLPDWVLNFNNQFGGKT